MLKFTDLVTKVLLEAATPDWYRDIITRFREVTSTTAITDVVPPAGELLKTLQIAIKGDVGNVSPRQISINLLSIFDLFVALTETSWGKQFKKAAGGTVESFISNCPGYDNPETGQIINNWTSTEALLWSDYSPLSRNGSEVQRKAQGEVDVLGKVALQTLNNQTILGATQAIVSKRVSALEAIASLRFGKFEGIIKDIFNRLPGYVSGAIKVSKDFDKLVDDLYIADIYSIAAYSAFFYDSEIDRLTTSIQTTPPEAEVEKETIVASLNLLDKHKNTSFIKEESTAAALAAALAATGVTAAVVNYIKKRPYDPGFINFIEKGIINTKIDNQAIKSDTVYTIGEIQKIQTQEARQLIQKLQNIAQYTKKRPGVGEIVGKAAGALGALRVGMGPVG